MLQRGRQTLPLGGAYSAPVAALESVPNVSEGRSPETVEAIGAAYAAAGAALLDTHSDSDHHRSVHTLVGADGADGTLVEAVFAGVAAAVERIDLRRHDGAHPRVGAADVVPIVPLTPQDGARAAAAALALGSSIGERLQVPVFLYGEIGGGIRPAFFRRGGPEALERRIDAGELVPAFGPTRLHPTAGAVLVGVRAPLVAFNVIIGGPDALGVANAVAERVRASGGGLPGVQAIGLRLRSTGAAQVSMNLIDLEVAALHQVVDRVRAEAVAAGAVVVSGELVGLLPASVVTTAAVALGARESGADGLPSDEQRAAAAEAFALPSLAADRVLEWHLARLGLDA